MPTVFCFAGTMLCFTEIHRNRLSGLWREEIHCFPMQQEKWWCFYFWNISKYFTHIIIELSEACECQMQCPSNLVLATSVQDVFRCFPSVSWGPGMCPDCSFLNPLAVMQVCRVYFKRRKWMPRHPEGTGQSHSRMTFLLENVFCL